MSSKPGMYGNRRSSRPTSGYGQNIVITAVAPTLDVALFANNAKRAEAHERHHQRGLKGAETVKSKRLGDVRPGTHRRNGVTLAGRNWSE